MRILDIKYFHYEAMASIFIFFMEILKAPLLQTAYRFINVTGGIDYNSGEN